MKRRSLLIGTAVVLTVCGCVLMAALHVLLEPNNFKEQIIDAVKKATGRELRISGDLHLSLYPELSLATGPLELSNAVGFDGPFATLEDAQLKVRLQPLLASRLEVVALTISKPVLFLSKNAKGATNWDDLLAADGSPASSPINGQEPAASVVNALTRLKTDARVPAFATLIVDGLHVRDARFVWKDAQSQFAMDVSRFGLDVAHFSFGQPFTVSTGADMQVGRYIGRVDFAAQSTFDLTRLDLRDVRLTGQISAPSLPQGTEQLAFTARHVSTDGVLEGGHLQGLGVDARFACRQDKGRVIGEAELSDCDVRKVAARIGLALPHLAAAATLQRLAGSFAWSVSGKEVRLNSVNIRVDDSRLTGSLTAGLQGTPHIQCDMVIDTLDMDRYRPAPPVEKSAGKPDTVKTGTVQGPPTAVGKGRAQFLRLVLDGKLRVGKLKVLQCRAENVQGTVAVRKGVVRVRDLLADLYGGKLQGTVEADMSGQEPVIATQVAVQEVQLGPLTRDATGRELLSGSLRSTAKVRLQGDTPDRLLRTLDGSADLRADTGVIRVVNIPYMVRAELGKLRGESPGAAEPDQTSYEVLIGSWLVRQGTASTSDLLLQAPRFKITARGSTHLATQSLDFKSVLYLSGSEGQLDSGILGVDSLPVNVGGTWAKPSVTPDMEGVVKRLGGTGGKAVKGILQGVGEGLGIGVRSLQRLLKR